MSDSSCSWADINEDLLEAIASRTALIEQIRFHAVCKNWSRLMTNIFKADELPRVMLYKWEPHPKSSICKIFDPLDQKMYTIDPIKLCGSSRQERREFPEVTISCYKNGWVVFQVSRGVLRRCGTFFVAYSPFTGQVVRLPELSQKKPIETILITFSSIPTSSDCVFLAMQGYVESFSYQLTISTYSASDRTWNKMTVCTNGKWLCRRGLVYLDGAFYGLFQCGSLGAFNVAMHEWSVLIKRDEKLSRGECSLVESDGKLLWVLVDDGKYEVARFDISRKKWVKKVSGLENGAVFFGDDNSSFLVPAVGKARELANTVNLFADKRCSSYKVGDDHDEVPHCIQIYSNLFDEIEDANGVEAIWIPPRVIYSTNLGSIN